MAKITLVKDLAQISPSITQIILSTMVGGDISSIEKHDPNEIYNVGDKTYQIIDGQIVIKECNKDGVTGSDFVTDWTVVENIIGTGGDLSKQDPNKNQNISYFEKKLASDLVKITNRLHSVIDLSQEGLEGTFMFPLYTSNEIKLTGGEYEFGRVII